MQSADSLRAHGASRTSKGELLDDGDGLLTGMKGGLDDRPCTSFAAWPEGRTICGASSNRSLSIFRLFCRERRPPRAQHVHRAELARPPRTRSAHRTPPWRMRERASASPALPVTTGRHRLASRGVRPSAGACECIRQCAGTPRPARRRRASLPNLPHRTCAEAARIRSPEQSTRNACVAPTSSVSTLERHKEK